MTNDEFEHRMAEFNAVADGLEAKERSLVVQFNNCESALRALVAEYDVALAKADEAGIARYFVGCDELRERQIQLSQLLKEVRAEYDELERHRPRPPRRTWSQFFGLK